MNVLDVGRLRVNPSGEGTPKLCRLIICLKTLHVVTSRPNKAFDLLQLCLTAKCPFDVLFFVSLYHPIGRTPSFAIVRRRKCVQATL